MSSTALLQRAGWRVSDDGLRASLPAARALPAFLLVLTAIGASMLAFFLVRVGPSWSPILLGAGLGIVLTTYAAVRGLRNRTTLAFQNGVFHCECAWPRERVTLAISDIRGFEGRKAARHKDMAHVVALVRDGTSIRLPIIVAEAAPVRGDALARAVAEALGAMLDDAWRRASGYRSTTATTGVTSAPAEGAGP